MKHRAINVVLRSETKELPPTAAGPPAEPPAPTLAAQHHILEEASLLLAAVQAAANALIITDRTGTIRWVNPAFERLTGYSAPEVLGQNPRLLKSLQQQDPAFFRKMWATILAGRVWHGELVNRRKDGSLYDEEMTITPVHNAGGEITHFIAIKQDVTERKAAEEARAKLAAVVEFSGDAILSKDLQGRVTSWNPAAQRLFGWTPEEILGQSITRTIPPELQPEEHQFLERLAQGGTIDHYETVRVTKDGRRIDVLVTIAPVRDSHGQVVGACKTIRDITDRKQTERALRQARDELERKVQERTTELREAVTELEQLSHSMVHDLRAPLRAIQGFGGVLLEDPDTHFSPEGRDLLDKMRASALRMDHLVCDVLNYTKVLRGQLPLHPVDVGPLVRGIVETYPNLQPARAQVTLAAHFPPVMGNESALTQCLSQLLSNAVKFAKPGQVPQVQVRGEPTGNGFVHIIVEDDGIGVAPELQPKVFGMFQHLSNTGHGTGMGLAIVRKAAERMRGRVGLESEPGRGSRFWLELPAVTSPETSSALG